MNDVMTITLLQHGAHGRMGTRVRALARGDERFDVVGAIDRAGAVKWSSDARQADVVVDFSAPEAVVNAVLTAESLDSALLVGTTGLDAGLLARIDEAAQRIPVMVAPNTSLGIAVLRRLVRDAARLLPPDFDVDILEEHHAKKRDAPSGTALALAESLRDAGREIAPDRIHAVRAGDIPGRHDVQFAGRGQVIRLGHEAGSRDVFAAGALHAAAWLRGRQAGRYAFDDCLD